jgi:hypothetical protein
MREHGVGAERVRLVDSSIVCMEIWCIATDFEIFESAFEEFDV